MNRWKTETVSEVMELSTVLENAFVNEIANFNAFGKTTVMVPFEWEVDGRKGTTLKAINEYWTSRQRQANSLHEISYRACFKPQLPEFFIQRLTTKGDAVYDPFMGRGTTPLEALLMGRKPMGNDINPLSQVLLSPRLNPPTMKQIEERLEAIDLSNAIEEYKDLLHFYHKDTLREIIALKEYLLNREKEGTIDNVDAWIRMVAINRLTGHSSGFFSVYSLPPNQAVTAERQKKINEERNQIPEYRPIKPRILKKSKSLLKDWKGVSLDAFDHDLSGLLSTSDSRNVPLVQDNSASLVVTSPPFLDVVDYQGDNWLRCWFIGVDSSTIEISQLKAIEDWEDTMTDVLKDLKRIVKPGGHIAFEVGEVRGGKVLLEENVVRCGVKAGLEPIIIMINDQEFTKTANAWGVDNSTKGTNTNRIVVFLNMARGKIEVKTSENGKYEELNFSVSAGKGTGRNNSKHKKMIKIKTEDMISETDEYHFAVKQQDEKIDECKVRRPVYVIRAKEKEGILKKLKGKKGWTQSLSILKNREPDYYLCIDICKLASAYGFDVETMMKLVSDSRFMSKPTELYVAEAVGGKATLKDDQPDVIVEDYNPDYLEKISGDCFPKEKE